MRRRLQTTLAGAFGSALMITPAAAAEAEKVWETEGLQTPESALYDGERDVLYVSNVAGSPTEKDGQGFISRVSPEGEMVEAEWVSGLDAPKGLGLHDGTLYVADIDRLVAIDVETGEVSAEHEGQGAKFLNDVTVDGEGRVYVSDMAANTIYRLEGDSFGIWVRDEALESPNGLFAEENRIVVGSWGVMTDGFATKVPGHLKAVGLESKEISSIGSGEAVGNLDGVEATSEGTYLATDWAGGALFLIDSSGKAEQLLDLNQGSADLAYRADEKLAIVPMMNDNKLVAYRIQ
jgi:sugar lactone lactonase YvrE